MKRLFTLLAALCLTGCTCIPATDSGAISDGNITPSSEAGACTACRQDDLNACGGRPSWCSCYPGPACCCKKVQP